jgi:hypothetical protein
MHVREKTDKTVIKINTVHDANIRNHRLETSKYCNMLYYLNILNKRSTDAKIKHTLILSKYSKT